MTPDDVNQPLDILWAPWRMKYILASNKPSRCIFCLDPSPESDRENHVLCRYRTCFAMLNRFPYNNGHILVAPYKHVGDLDSLSEEELLELMTLLRDCRKALSASMSPDGFNAGFNLGSAAGAGVEGHIHLHVVPRWRGDTNFMTVTAGTKVIPQSLDEVYDMLRPFLSSQNR